MTNPTNAVLTAAAVRAIRAAPYTYGSGVKLARQYGVHPSIISTVRSRKAWSHVR